MAWFSVVESFLRCMCVAVFVVEEVVLSICRCGSGRASESSVRESWAGATQGYGGAAISESLVRTKEEEPLCKVR